MPAENLDHDTEVTVAACFDDVLPCAGSFDNLAHVRDA
jgi:hypothetical protein